MAQTGDGENPRAVALVLASPTGVEPTTCRIAEWAENAEIIEVLRGLGVDYAQGYGVSQPQKVQRAAIA